MVKVFENRIFRCGESHYVGEEILRANETHTDERLGAIATAGFNGIWLRVKLREIVPTSLFTEYVRGAQERLGSLAKLCRRAKKFGLGVWPYFTEPLGMRASDSFWRDHRDLAGPQVQIYDWEPRLSLCPSTEAVQRYLQEGFAGLFGKVPLAGAILITTSEHVSHCWSHVLSNPAGYPNAEGFWKRQCSCPRCQKHRPEEIISGIIGAIHEGIHSVRPEAKVAAWDWSWNMHWNPPYKKMIARLPEEVILMGDFERGGSIRRNGKGLIVEEYSLMYPGPSRRFRGEARLVKGRRPLWAKLQINTTHELATVPNMPLVVALYRKFKFLRASQAAGYMACWNFGCMPDTLNTFAVKELSGKRFDGTERQWLMALAEKYFGREIDAAGVVKAWYGFLRAGEHYPIGGNNMLLYFGPVNYALGYPLPLKFEGAAMGPSWQKHTFGDRLGDTAVTYTLEQIRDMFGELSGKWSEALAGYEQALWGVKGNERQRKELGVAHIVGATFRSTYNIYRWYLLRRRKRTVKLSAAEQGIVRDEWQNLREVLPWVQADQRVGFHQEAQWQMFSAATIRRKLRQLQGMLE